MYLRKEFTFCKCINIDSSFLIHVEDLSYILVKMLWRWIFFHINIIWCILSIKTYPNDNHFVTVSEFLTTKENDGLKKNPTEYIIKPNIVVSETELWSQRPGAWARGPCDQDPHGVWILDEQLQNVTYYFYFCLCWFQLLQCGVWTRLAPK